MFLFCLKINSFVSSESESFGEDPCQPKNIELPEYIVGIEKLTGCMFNDTPCSSINEPWNLEKLPDNINNSIRKTKERAQNISECYGEKYNKFNRPPPPRPHLLLNAPSNLKIKI